MKKILLSLAIIAVVSATSVGATQAYWTSDATADMITFSTGTLKISDVSAGTWVWQVVFDNLKPGDTIKRYITIQNDGSLPVGSLTASAINVVDNSSLLHQLPGWAHRDMLNPNNEVQVGYNTDGATLLSNIEYLDGGVTLLPGERMHAIIYFQVPTTLGDTWQGKTATFNMLFHAEQIH